MSKRSLKSRFWYQLLSHVCEFAGVLVFSIRHTGRENVPRDGGVLIVSNHQCNMDPPLVGIGTGRRINVLAKKDLFKFPPFRWLISSIDAIPLDRDRMGLAGVKESLRRLKRGEMVLVFPEGTRTRDGQIGPFKPGFTTLARRSKVPILPVVMEGGHGAWPRGQLLPAPYPIHFHYCRPIFPTEAAQFSDEELLIEVRRRMCETHVRMQAHSAFRGRGK